MNNGLNIDSWKVINDTTRGNAKLLLLGIDETSFETIKRGNMLVNFRFGFLKVRQSSSAGEKDQQEDSEGSGTETVTKNQNMEEGVNVPIGEGNSQPQMEIQSQPQTDPGSHHQVEMEGVEEVYSDGLSEEINAATLGNTGNKWAASK